MRSRRRSSVQLDSYYRIVYQTILCHQDANTGLLPGDAGRNICIKRLKMFYTVVHNVSKIFFYFNIFVITSRQTRFTVSWCLDPWQRLFNHVCVGVVIGIQKVRRLWRRQSKSSWAWKGIRKMYERAVKVHDASKG